MTGLGASTGTGNIAGVATAIVTGGPGAVFWIWCYGFFATAIKLAEAMLAVRFRSSSRRARCSTGPMHYLEEGLGSRRLGLIYAAIAGVAALTTTPFTQPNSVAVVFESELGVPTWVTGVAMAVLVWAVMIGGVQVDRPRRLAARAGDGHALPRRRAGGDRRLHRAVCRRSSRWSSARRSRPTRAAGGAGRHRHDDGDALRPRARHLRQRGGLRHRRGGLRHARTRTGRSQQGLNAMIEVIHRLVRHLDDQRAHRAADRRLATSGLKSTALVAEAFRQVIPSGGLLVCSAPSSSAARRSSAGATTASSSCTTCFGPRVVDAVPLDLLRPGRGRRDAPASIWCGPGAI